jgi:hypothetical protein
MRRSVSLPLLVLAVACNKTEKDSPSAPAVKATPAPSGAANWIEADPKQPLAGTLSAQAALAVKNGKKPHAYLHADWCDPCVAIEKTRATDPKMVAAFAPAHIIAIDVDHVPEAQIVEAGMKVAVLPIFYRLDENGKPTGAQIDGGAWGDNIPDNMAPPLGAFFGK